MAGTVGLPAIPNMLSRHSQWEIWGFSMEGNTEFYFEAGGSSFGRTKAEGSMWSSLASLDKQRDIISH